MDFSPYWIFQFLSGLVIALLSFLMYSTRDELASMRLTLSKTREDYVHNDDLRDLKQDLSHRFDRLENLINGKEAGD